MSFDKAKAVAVLAKLPLSEASRRFADCWLALVSNSGAILADDPVASVSDDLQLRLVSFEIAPHMVRIKSAGRHVTDAVGMELVGMDYLQMAPPAQRATRMARMCSIVEGHISTHQRWLVNSAGKLHVLNELAVPCGLSENGLPMIMTYVDVDAHGAVGHIPPKSGAMNIAPVFNTYPIH